MQSNYPGEIPVLIYSKNAVTQRLGTGRPHPGGKGVCVPKSWSFLQAGARHLAVPYVTLPYTPLHYITLYCTVTAYHGVVLHYTTVLHSI